MSWIRNFKKHNPLMFWFFLIVVIVLLIIFAIFGGILLIVSVWVAVRFAKNAINSIDLPPFSQITVRHLIRTGTTKEEYFKKFKKYTFTGNETLKSENEPSIIGEAKIQYTIKTSLSETNDTEHRLAYLIKIYNYIDTELLTIPKEYTKKTDIEKVYYRIYELYMLRYILAQYYKKEDGVIFHDIKLHYTTLYVNIPKHILKNFDKSTYSMYDIKFTSELINTLMKDMKIWKVHYKNDDKFNEHY